MRSLRGCRRLVIGSWHPLNILLSVQLTPDDLLFLSILFTDLSFGRICTVYVLLKMSLEQSDSLKLEHF